MDHDTHRAGLILVTGATGTLGRMVADRLRAKGCSVRLHGRRPRGPGLDGDYVRADLATGDGIGLALDGVTTIVHCAGSPKGDEIKARNLVQAAARSGVRHIVNISVVGADRIPMTSGIDRTLFGYYASKLGAERAIMGSGIPWTNLRATQFHQLILTTVSGMARLPLIPVPPMRFQPLDAAEVADRLVELTLRAPAATVPDVAGPRIHTMSELIRSYLRATGRRRMLIPVPMPGSAARALSTGANLAPEHANGGRSWEDFLSSHLHP